MKEFKGTKGEWNYKYDKENYDFTIYSTGVDYIAHTSSYDEVGESNAKLIAAAPELLGALQNITEEFEALCNGLTFGDTLRANDFRLIAEAKDAIKKAL